MRWIIEARLDDGVREASHKGGEVLAVFERRDRCLSQLGLTLAEGRSLLAKVQSDLLSQQVAAWLPSAKRDRLPLLRFDLASQRQSFHRAAHRVRQGEGHEPTAVVLCLPKGAAPLHASVGQGAAQTRHAGVGIYAGQVGRPPAVQGSHCFAEGGAAGWTRRSRSAAPGTNKLPCRGRPFAHDRRRSGGLVGCLLNEVARDRRADDSRSKFVPRNGAKGCGKESFRSKDRCADAVFLTAPKKVAAGG